MKRAFNPFGDQIELTTTTSGIEALLLLSEQKPHGLLMDLNLRDVDALDVCRRIRARKQFEFIRVIMMSGARIEVATETSLKAGAAACLAKPVDAQQVLDLFRVPLALSHKR